MKNVVLPAGTLWSMAKESVTAWIDDFAPSMGAAIAYYTAFSLAPLLIIVIAIAGFAFGEEAASGYLYGQISGLVGDEGGLAVQDPSPPRASPRTRLPESRVLPKSVDRCRRDWGFKPRFPESRR